MNAKGWGLGLLGFLCCAAASGLLSGCGAGIAGLVAALSSKGGGGSGGAVGLDAPATVAFEATPRALGSPDRMEIRYKVRNDDAGKLAARIEVIRVQVDDTFRVVTDPRGEPIPLGPAIKAVPAPGSAPADALPNDNFVTFVWDVKQTLGEDSAMVQVIVTPIEDGKAGQPERSAPFRAGNEPVGLSDLTVRSIRSLLRVTFVLADKESDPADVRLHLSVNGAGFVEIPPELIGRTRFESAPGGGTQQTFLADLALLAEYPELREALSGVALPGFVGEVAARLSSWDFPGEPIAMVETALRVDNNEPPTVEILDIPPEALSSGIVPIRYRLYDVDRNPAGLLVEVDLGDNAGFRMANEFPLPPSEGTSGLCTLHPYDPTDLTGCAGGAGGGIHTFLWDAASQPPSGETVLLRIRAADREQGPAATRSLTGIARAGVRYAGEIAVSGIVRSLAAADIDRDGYSDLVLTYTGSTDLTYLRGTATGFTAGKTIPLGVSLQRLAIDDFDGDGYWDIVGTGALSNTALYLAGTSSGPSDEPLELLEVTDPGEMVTGDFNADSFRDLLILNRGSDDASYFEGPSLSLGFRETIACGDSPWAAVTGDFNRDGILDVAIANRRSNDITYLPGSLSGLTRQGGDIPIGSRPNQLAAGDVDGDGISDVIVLTSTGFVAVLRGTREGISPRGEPIEVGANPKGLAVADFDGDGISDVAVANNGSDDVSYLRGTKDGLIRGVPISAGDSPVACAVGDFDRDGAPDLIVTSNTSQSLSCLRGSREGLRRAGPDIRLPGYSGAIVTGDFDRDGFLEVMVANTISNKLMHLRGVGSGLVKVRDIDTAATGRATSIVGGDFDGDGISDVLVANRDAGTVSYLRGSGRGLVAMEEIPTAPSPSRVETGDFDGDGMFDALVQHIAEGSGYSFLRGTDAGFVHGAYIQLGSSLPHWWLQLGDFDGDGYLDAVNSDLDGNSVVYIRGSADGPVLGSVIPVGMAPRPVVRGDFDGDGFLDIAVGNRASYDVTYLRGGRSGLVPAPKTIPVGGSPTLMMVGDYDADGILDVVATMPERDSIVCLCGTPSGLERGPEIPVGLLNTETTLRPECIASADFDGDGYLDAVISNQDSDDVSYLRGSAGGLVFDRNVKVGYYPERIFPGDFDGDGLLDMVVNNAGWRPGCSNDATYLRGSHRGPVREGGGEIRLSSLCNPDGGTTGDLDGDGFLDFLGLTYGGSATYYRGTTSGLVFAGEFWTGFGAYLTPQIADYDGDGLLDAAVLAYEPQDNAGFSYLRQRFLLPHVNVMVDPSKPPEALVDPRGGSRYRLELAQGAFEEPTRVCILPGEHFALPQGQAFGRGKYLTTMTDPVRILRDATRILTPAILTLRLRDRVPEPLKGIPPERWTLRVFRKNLETDEAEDLRLGAGEIAIVEFAGAKGIAFPIKLFGTYLVAVEVDR